MKANGHTKLSAILKAHPGALEAVVAISPKFVKLRNPLLRSLMAGRTSVAMASKIGGCTVADFLHQLEPLGFEIETTTATETLPPNTPGFIDALTPAQLVELDVRPMMEGGKDPLEAILKSLKTLAPQQVLKVINSFEPAPLIVLLEKQGFEAYVELVQDDLVNTYFHKSGAAVLPLDTPKVTTTGDWDSCLQKYAGQLVEIDVRQLEMPLPMMTILSALDDLPVGKALYVHHKRIPVFLLPELAERKMDYRIKEINDHDVLLLIFHS